MGLQILLSILALAIPAAGARVKDLAHLEGVRDNQLIGYGLVIGLAGTGDRQQVTFSIQSLTNLLQRMGVQVNPLALRVRNLASVMVTATLPPFSRSGAKLDVTVGSVGDATNLQGGLLLLTELKGPDGEAYAVAQGPVVTGGFVAGGAGNRQVLNHPTVGRIAGGALVERPAPSVVPVGGFRLQLNRADFTTAARVSEAVNRRFGDLVARAESSGSIFVRLPAEWASRTVEFVAQVEDLAVEADRAAKVVVNERTGTIVLGKEVRIAPVAILHGGLSVEIRTTFDVSQPAPLGQGQTQTVPQVAVEAREQRAQNVILDEGATVEDLVRALNAIGSTARDIIAILQNLRAAGALDAELEIL